MQKKLNVVLFFLIYSISISYSQSVGVCFYRYSDNPIDTVVLQEKIAEARKLMANCDTSACVATKLHFIASVYYALEYPEDTIKYYLDKAKRLSPTYFCRLVETSSLTVERSEFMKEKGCKYFANSFSTEWWETFTKECEKYKTDAKAPKKAAIKIQNPEYLTILEHIMVDDQKYRENMDSFFLQAELDNDNRLKLDSLYNLYGFPSLEQTSKEGSNIAWYVVQHSTDCEWTKKWLTRFLVAYQKKECKAGWLDTTFKRFFDPENGFCTKEDLEGSKEFIAKLLQDFPMDYAEIFGYGKF